MENKEEFYNFMNWCLEQENPKKSFLGSLFLLAVKQNNINIENILKENKENEWK